MADPACLPATPGRMEPRDVIGESIAHYSITAKIGAGGMGEVWRATDAKLGRDVALKILPEIFSADPERMARFHREAQVLASLNHPNIAAIYGVEESDGRRVLVLELVEGGDLSHRLRSGPLPLDEALEIGGQIAEAVEAAHDKGVVHRDLKPANVKLTPDGKVKVLDFGLAKALEGEPGASASDPSQSLSPTLTVAATRMGVVLGTAAYMSPEQAKGKVVDRRADIWSFGVVLFEMLAGGQLFSGETVSDTLASVIKDEPDWSLLPAGTPPAVADLLRRCLVKDVRRRLQSIGEARIAIEDVLRPTAATLTGSRGETTARFGGSMSGQGSAAAQSGLASAARVARRGPGLATWIASLAIVAIAGVGATMWLLGPPRQDLPARKFALEPAGLELPYRRAPVISPDGRRIAYVAEDSLWIRDLDTLEPRQVPGSASAHAPFWSPDGESLAYETRGSLYKVEAAGGQPVVISELGTGRYDGGAWGPDGTIYMVKASGAMLALSAMGGEPRPFIDAVEGEASDYHTPHVLPGARGVLYTVHGPEGPDTIEVFAEGRRRVVLKMPGERIEGAVYAPSGHILYFRRTRSSGVWAVPFSLASLETTGDPFLLDPKGAWPSVAGDGTLLYALGAASSLRHLALVDRTGKVTGTIGQPQPGLNFPEVSWDGTRVLVSSDAGDNRDMWVHDIERGTQTRMTFEDAQEWAGAWFPGDDRIVYSGGMGNTSLLSRAADGTDEPVVFVERGELPSFRPGVPWAVFMVPGRPTGDDLFYVSLESGAEPQPLLTAPGGQWDVQMSPDGNYVAYGSDESGEEEIYLKKFPSGEGKWQVSVNGGGWARWSRKGDELYYLEEQPGGTALMMVKVTTAPALKLSTPQKLFDSDASADLLLSSGPRMYDVHPDGEHFVIVQAAPGDQPEKPRLVISQNWIEAYRKAE